MKKMNDYYAHQPNLTKQQINDILRLCHRSLEEHMQMEFTDEQFLQIFSIWRKYTPIHAYHFTPIANSVHYNKLFSPALCNHYRIKNIGQANQLAWNLKQWLEADFPTARQYKHIVLHIPHAGTEIMSEAKECLEQEIEKDSQYQIDYFTDELFAGAMPDDWKDKIIPIIFPYNRLLCDVERLPNDPRLHWHFRSHCGHK